MNKLTRTSAAWALALVFTVSSIAQAATNEKPKPSTNYDEVCKDVMALQGGIEDAGSSAWSVAQQKLSYCKAAKDAKAAASTNKMLSGVWGAVAGTCTAICIASMTGYGYASQPYCTYANIGGAVIDMAKTKEFTSGLTALGSTVGGIMINKTMSKGNTAPKQVEVADESGGHMADAKPEGETDWGACFTAATAAITTFTKKNTADSSKQAAEANTRNASLLGPVDSVTGPTTSNLATTSPNVITNNVTTNNARVTGGTGLASDEPNKPAQNACDGAASSGNTARVTSCALASDKNLPKAIATADFNRALKKATGEDLGGFVKKGSENPTQAMTAASGLTGEAGSKYSQLLAAAEKSIDYGHLESGEGETYAGGGGAPSMGGQEEGGGGNDLAAMMAKMLKGDKEEEAKDTGNIKFDPKTGAPPWLRGPASADDRAFSLFDRVTYRYYFVGRRIIFDEEQTPIARQMPNARH